MAAPVAAPWVEVRSPADQEEGTRSQVLRWLKAVGEPVTLHEPLIELETDKVTVEVAAPGTGVLEEILKDEQAEVVPGELLGRIRTGPAPNTATLSAAIAARGGQPVAAGSGGLPQPDELPGHTSMAARAPRPAGAQAQAAPPEAVRLSPAVRRLLAERGLDPATVSGTGEGGRITVDDVLRSGETRDAHGAPAATGTPVRAVPPDGKAADAASVSVAQRIAHSALRRRIAARMVDSLLHTAPHVTTVFEIDMTAVLAHRRRHRADFERQGAALTLTAYFVRAAIEAIRAVPEANSRWTDEALEVFAGVEFGIGTATPQGLVVPVLHRADTLDLLQTARGIGELARRARAGELTPAEVRGGTFTISNHGVSGSLLATPIIIPQPQSAILGIGKLEKRAVVIERAGVDEIVARPRCYATLTLDHRVMDGERANRFMQVLAERIENWPEGEL